MRVAGLTCSVQPEHVEKRRSRFVFFTFCFGIDQRDDGPGCECGPPKPTGAYEVQQIPTNEALLQLVVSDGGCTGSRDVINGDTTPTCTRADAHFSRAHITVHNSFIGPHSSNVVTSTLAQGKRDQCRAFLKNLVISSSCSCLVFFSFVSLLSLHFLLVLCHDFQRH